MAQEIFSELRGHDGEGDTSLYWGMLNPSAPFDQLVTFSRQVSHLMREVQLGLYMAPISEGGLGLKSLDPQVPCDPTNDVEIERRAKRYSHYQTTLETAGSECLWAVIECDDNRQPRLEPGALVGLLILSRIELLRINPLEQPLAATEIMEWDVREDKRGQGIGSALLKAALPAVPRAIPNRLSPDADLDLLFAEVIEQNEPALGIYKERLGFTANGARTRYSVFDTTHIQLRGRVGRTMRWLNGDRRG